jgi:hypothetical protein
MNARYLVASALLAFAPAGFATETMELTGVGTGTVAGGVYVSPYVGTINDGAGTTYSGYMICDDFNTESYLNKPWSANETGAADALSGPVKFKTSLTGYTAQQNYDAAAWLANQLVTPGVLGSPSTQISYSFAIWDIFDGQTTDPIGGANGALGLEGQAFKAVTAPGYAGGSNVSVYTPVNFSDSQEFLVVNKIAAPEIDPTSAASSLTLLLGALAVVRGRTKRATVA